MSTAFWAADAEAVRQSLAQTTDFRIFPLLAETVLWAIFTVLIATSTYILLSRGLQSRSNQVMLTLTLVMYALSTLDWAIDVRRVWTDLKISLPAELSSPVPGEDELDKLNVALRIVQAITNNVCVLLSDVVVCWRVCVVFGKDKRVIGMAVMLLAALASGLFLCNLTQIGEGFPDLSSHLRVLAPHELPIDIVALVLSALVNIWATSMIAYRAWTCRREIRHHLENKGRKSFTESMLTLFLESGTIYTVLWILRNIILLPVVENSPYTNYSALVMYQMTGMYPTVIIVLVTLQKSHLENQFTYPGIPEEQDAAMSFASRASHGIAGRVTIRDMVFVQNSSDVSSGSLNDSTSKTEGEKSSKKEVLDV
ncbi:hypothetical protein PENSPDRAFT_97250 [Peniophora sp. CONT]|nr:hypothetical protein PENSPDRAFT_97250 [Peniophora sp. CONT]